MSNVPDDWDCYYRICENCEKRYHLSGDYECDCEVCYECYERQPPYLWTLDPDGEICDICCQKEEPPTDKWTLADIAYAEYKDNPPGIDDEE